MTEGLEALSGEYHGRIIILGRAESGKNVIAYAVTGRSSPSRARKFELDAGAIKTAPTNPDDLKKGNPALLIYPAIMDVGYFGVVSNGAQTSLIAGIANHAERDFNLTTLLSSSFMFPHHIGGIDITSYEPDAPNYTPRISGVLARERAALSIIKHELGDNVSRSFFEFPLIAGRGKAISTYTGQNVPKGAVIPSFRGEPLDVELKGTSAEEIAHNFYQTLGPKEGPNIVSPGDDFRVGVAVAFYDHDSVSNQRASSYILNRVDMEKK